MERIIPMHSKRPIRSRKKRTPIKVANKRFDLSNREMTPELDSYTPQNKRNIPKAVRVETRRMTFPSFRNDFFKLLRSTLGIINNGKATRTELKSDQKIALRAEMSDC
jgi:hypothetical protein